MSVKVARSSKLALELFCLGSRLKESRVRQRWIAVNNRRWKIWKSRKMHTWNNVAYTSSSLSIQTKFCPLLFNFLIERHEMGLLKPSGITLVCFLIRKGPIHLFLHYSTKFQNPHFILCALKYEFPWWFFEFIIRLAGHTRKMRMEIKT